MKIIKYFFALVLFSSIFMALFAIISAYWHGGRNIDVVMVLLFSPIQIIFLHYDVIVLGKLKLISSLLAFYGGAFLFVTYFWLKKDKITKVGGNLI